MKKEKVILAYSGGLDTSVILKWLMNKGYQVICFVGNVGQKESFEAIEKKALQTGALKVYVEDLREEFVVDYIYPALRANAAYEGRYLLGTALSRPLLAKRQIEIAMKEKTLIVAHGATGKGNDQVRFELSYYALNPNILCISPWREPEFISEFKGRADLINYAQQWDIPIKTSKANSYSEDENLLHISHEAGVLEDPAYRPPENVFSASLSPEHAPDRETVIDIYFKDGNPIKVVNKGDGTVKEKPLDLFLYLNELGSRNGIGRLDMIENRYIGIKSRGIYETPGGTILWKAHRDLEGIAMDKEVMHLRDSLIPKFSELLYNGFWFSPEVDFLMAAFNKSQEAIDGKVAVSLYKGNVTIIGRESPISLYNKALSSMEIEGGFNTLDSSGFINIAAMRLKAHHVVLRKRKPYQWRETALWTHKGKRP
ncbi:MAG: argininosuccinate synthase [Deltaproteobacteria bacterium]|nr:argininosuccinate synthase [Deltaproteobacteria bacterium]MBW2076862.1 argininosuccinate synthase [Deltaproteobacteria bacterium]MBW2311480.1 argininosuccinate synthase [Deltaproteobacteria bacterium]RLB29903.1 MAG: argininosuccinate synthase [Deltaproteobacteria bacterium]